MVLRPMPSVNSKDRNAEVIQHFSKSASERSLA